MFALSLNGLGLRIWGLSEGGSVAYQFVTDLEGPITLNDNALELTRFFLPQGDIFFTQISRYDDYLAWVARRRNYQAGDTLKLILPFLKAYGATQGRIKEFSATNLLLLQGASDALRKISQEMSAFIISTSYEPYIEAFCERINFPRDRVYCTSLNLNRYELSKDQTNKLRVWREEIVNLPLIELPAGVTTLSGLSLPVQNVLKRLDQIFWEEIPAVGSNKIFMSTSPMGGRGKVEALRDTLRKTGNNLSEVMYVGDSITDGNVLRLVKEKGVAISFNGNGYALEAAEFACISEGAQILFTLAATFNSGGREKVLNFVKDYKKSFPLLERVNDSNKDDIIRESENFRRKLRGKAGALG